MERHTPEEWMCALRKARGSGRPRGWTRGEAPKDRERERSHGGPEKRQREKTQENRRQSCPKGPGKAAPPAVCAHCGGCYQEVDRRSWEAQSRPLEDQGLGFQK